MALSTKDQDLGHRELVGMRDREERGSATHRGEPSRGPAMKVQAWRAAGAEHLHVAPQHTERMPGAERFHRGFLRGEASGKMNGRLAAAGAVGDLALSEDAAEETIAVPLDDVGDAVYVGG